MSLKKRLTAALVTLAACAALLAPTGAADVTFTAINERVLSLSDDTMPIWSGKVLYVPYTTFDATANGMLWGIECSYNKSSSVVTVFDLDKRLFLEFDLREGTCRDGLTGEEFEPGAILRGSQPYLPVKTVCSFFDLRYTYRDIEQGSLLRIKTRDVVLSDNKFIDAASNVLSLRLREYDQTTDVPAPPANDQPDTPAPPPAQEDEQRVNTYLSIRCETGTYLPALLTLLDNSGTKAMFFVTPELARERNDLLLWMLGAGHSVGLTARGETAAQTAALLDEGSDALEESAFLRTTVALVPPEQRRELGNMGWLCWNTTLELTPQSTDAASSFSHRTVQRLSGRTRAVYLALPENENGLRVLPTLLRTLKEEGYDLALPLETRL